MRRMITHSKLLLDQLGHPASGPDITKKAVGCGALFEQLNQLGALGGVKQRCRARRRVVTQGSSTTHAGTFEPLTNRRLRNTQGFSYMHLGPAQLMQMHGTQATAFGPASGLRGIWCIHTLEQSIFRPTIIRSLCSYQ